jgi:23S rRNA (pseudouridine1915-N3)-methyltransferase
MRLLILAIGRARSSVEGSLYEHYAGRITWPLELRELEEKRPLAANELKLREGELLLGALPPRAFAIVLDQRGKQLDSRAFALELDRLRQRGTSEVAFVIGGADGVSDEVRSRAGLVLSLGAATWPHLLVRAMLAEQIYRAQQILSGHPYHRD